MKDPKMTAAIDAVLGDMADEQTSLRHALAKAYAAGYDQGSKDTAAAAKEILSESLKGVLTTIRKA